MPRSRRAGRGSGNAPALLWSSVVLVMSQLWCGTEVLVLRFLVMPQSFLGVLGDASSGLGLERFWWCPSPGMRPGRFW